MRTLSSRARFAVGAAGALLLVLLAWFLLIAPKRAEASELTATIEATEAQIAERRAELAAGPGMMFRFSDVFRLTKAMPNERDMPELLLELSRLARATGVVLRSVAPQAPSAGSGYEVLPMTVVVRGRYGELTSFLARTRRQVRVDDGRFSARGRLLSVGALALAEAADATFPILDATLTLNAYSFESTPVTPDATSVTEPTTTTTDGSTATAAAPRGTP